MKTKLIGNQLGLHVVNIASCILSEIRIIKLSYIIHRDRVDSVESWPRVCLRILRSDFGKTQYT
jgi:hypothetical protein